MVSAPKLKAKVLLISGNFFTQANSKIKEAEALRANGTGQERVRAAGQLVFLKGRKDELEARTRELGAVQDGLGATVVQWIKEDWLILMQRLQVLMEQ
jgi:hypothetical protein